MPDSLAEIWKISASEFHESTIALQDSLAEIPKISASEFHESTIA
jgi:hypothetical protein